MSETTTDILERIKTQISNETETIIYPKIIEEAEQLLNETDDELRKELEVELDLIRKQLSKNISDTKDIGVSEITAFASQGDAEKALEVSEKVKAFNKLRLNNLRALSALLAQDAEHIQMCLPPREPDVVEEEPKYKSITGKKRSLDTATEQSLREALAPVVPTSPQDNSLPTLIGVIQRTIQGWYKKYIIDDTEYEKELSDIVVQIEPTVSAAIEQSRANSVQCSQTDGGRSNKGKIGEKHGEKKPRKVSKKYTKKGGKKNNHSKKGGNAKRTMKRTSHKSKKH